MTTRMGRNPFERKSDFTEKSRAFSTPAVEPPLDAEAPESRVLRVRGFSLGFMIKLPLRVIRVGLKSVLVVKYLVSTESRATAAAAVDSGSAS